VEMEFTACPLSECLESVDTPEGRERVADFLRGGPFPHYQPHPDRPGLLVRIDADGSRTVGRFVNREWWPSARSPSGGEREYQRGRASLIHQPP
jgi:hypothetical protein